VLETGVQEEVGVVVESDVFALSVVFTLNDAEFNDGRGVNGASVTVGCTEELVGSGSRQSRFRGVPFIPEPQARALSGCCRIESWYHSERPSRVLRCMRDTTVSSSMLVGMSAVVAMVSKCGQESEEEEVCRDWPDKAVAPGRADQQSWVCNMQSCSRLRRQAKTSQGQAPAGYCKR
jgi:hypothetical protein